MYEIFNRLNSGGINLKPQEIRRCTFDSQFYEMLYKTNAEQSWRDLVGTKVPDIHMRDVEILLRGFAMLTNEDSYRPSMVKFLNKFSQEAQSFDQETLSGFKALLDSFLESCRDLPSDAFHSINGRFSPMIFESVFVAACREPHESGCVVEGSIDLDSLNELKEDEEFRRTPRLEECEKATQRARCSDRFDHWQPVRRTVGSRRCGAIIRN